MTPPVVLPPPPGRASRLRRPVARATSLLAAFALATLGAVSPLSATAAAHTGASPVASAAPASFLRAAQEQLEAELGLDVPETLSPGEGLDPWAEGFPEGAQVEFLLDGAVIGSETVTNGAAVLGFSLPAGTSPGEHTVTARSGTLVITKTINVVGGASPAPEGSVPGPPAQPEAPSQPEAPGDPAETCPAPEGTKVTLDHGHVDMFDLVADFSGALSLKLKEDVTGQGVTHDPEEVLLQVKEAAKAPVKDQAAAGEWAFPTAVATRLGLSASSVYYLPEVQNHERDLLWPGWDILATRPGGYKSATFDISFKGPQDGRVFAFTSGAFGDLGSVLKDKGYELAAGGATIDQPFLAHKHSNWVFSQPGRYTFKVVAHAAKEDGTVTSATERTYTIDVGSYACPQPKPEAPKTDKPEAPKTDKPEAPKPQGPLACTPHGAEIVLDHGHLDMFDLSANAKGGLSLKLKEDVTGRGVLRSPESVLLRVKPEAWHDSLPDVVAQAAGSTSGYLLPQNQDNNLLWPGWDTQGIKAATEAGYQQVSLDITYTSTGDGRIALFKAGLSGKVESVLADGSTVLEPKGSTLVQPYPAHAHANWVLTKAGRYTLHVTPRVTGADGKEVKLPTSTYTIDAGKLSCAGEYPKTGEPGTDPNTGGSGNGSGSNTGNTAGSGNGSGSNTGNTAGSGSAGGAPAGNTKSGSATEVCVPTEITREATEQETKQLANGATSSSSGSGAASANKATTTLSLSVGPGASGDATEGHFDLGPVIEDGTLLARVKDDRSSPAKWVDPASLTFVLGDAASMKAPKALSFVAEEGKTVWMVPSTQKSGVPWLGMSSQREEIVSGTSGEVVFALESVEGPGKVAVFEAGSLGGGVGNHVFDGPGSSYTLPKNTHAHQNWVFTEPGSYKLTISMSVKPSSGELKGSNGSAAGAAKAPALKVVPGKKGDHGRPMVKVTVGRTPSGAECDLDAAAKAGRLARTGADAPGLVGASAGMLAAGVLLAAARRRRSRTQA